MLRFLLLCCVSTAFDVSQHLASKSPYGDRGTTAFQQATPPPATCVPIHINLLSRHGSRYPTKGSIRNYLALEETLHKLNASNPAFSWLNEWKCQYNFVTAGQLLPLGEDELYSLGKRLTGQFPEIFQGAEYNPRFFPIRTTQKPRAAQSGTAFGYSVFEGQGHLGDARFLPFYIHSASADSDKILYFHNICPAYLLYLETKVHKVEYAQYVETRLTQVVQSVLTKIGSTSHGLSPYHVIYMYELCAVGTLAKNSDTDFCTLFEEEDLELLEYADDLESYWKKFYGKDINWQMSVLLLQDIVAEMNLAATGGAKATRGSFRFAHGETLAPLLGLLGLYRDQPALHHDLPLHTMLNRKWRQSQILPMGANFMTILYNCSQEPVLKILVNEVEVSLPRCGIYCPLKLFKQLYATELSLNYDEICDISDSGVRPPLAAVGAFFVITGALGICAVCFKEQRTGLGSDRNGNGRSLGKRIKLKPEN